MPRYLYFCDACDGGQELTRHWDVATVPCPCGSQAKRSAVNKVYFGGFARTPSDQRDWSKDFKDFREANAELDYKKERLEDATQTRIADPPLGAIAASRAKELIGKGVTLDDL